MHSNVAMSKNRIIPFEWTSVSARRFGIIIYGLCDEERKNLAPDDRGSVMDFGLGSSGRNTVKYERTGGGTRRVIGFDVYFHRRRTDRVSFWSVPRKTVEN